VIFESVADLARMDDDDFDVEASDVLVLRNAGPKGAPGMPERAICRSRRNCCAKASRTWCGSARCPHVGDGVRTIVLHVTPEAAIGGPLALRAQRDRSGSTSRLGGSTS